MARPRVKTGDLHARVKPSVVTWLDGLKDERADLRSRSEALILALTYALRHMPRGWKP
jgi:hypothetical protein